MMIRRALAVLAARVAIGFLLLGIPAALLVLAGNPLPTWSQWLAIVRLEPDWGNAVLLGKVLPCAAWIAWAIFAYPLVGELLRHRTGRPILPTPAVLRGQQRLAAALVATALMTSSPVQTVSETPTIARAHQSLGAQSGTGQVDLAAFHAPGTVHRGHTSEASALVPSETVVAYEVHEGDTLWDIADRRLGFGTDYPAIVDASVGIVQPGGRHLTDPNLILPGWHLDIPTTGTPNNPDRSTARPTRPIPRSATTSAPARQSGRSETAAPTGSRSSSPAVRPAGADPHPVHLESGPVIDAGVVPMAIGGGVAALLAAGLTAGLAGRRRRQRATRRFGERLPLPDSGSPYDIEVQLRAVSDPEARRALQRALAHVLDMVRRTSAPLPRLFAVRVDEAEITLYLNEPAALAEPFQSLFSDGTAWSARRDAFAGDVDPHATAPYPALVTVGTDLDGGILLLDLEQEPHLTISGPHALVRGMLTAMAAELASTPWGEDIHLSLVGVPEHLPLELDPYRIHSVPDTASLVRDIRTHLEDRRAALDAAASPDIREARLRADDVESWAPFIVFIGTSPSPSEQRELGGLLRQHASSGLVVVQAATPTTPDAEIDLTQGAATYRSSEAGLPPLPFIPQLLDDHALEQLLQMFTLGPTTQGITTAGEAPEPLPHSAVSVSLSAAIDHGHTATDPTRSEPNPTTPEPPDRALWAPEHPGVSPHPGTAAPYLRLLGQVGIEHLDRPELMPGRGVELLTYLLHHRQPVPGAQIQKALWPTSYDRTNGNARTLAKQVRAALGHDPDGHLWLPEGRGSTGFALHPDLRSDWQDFIALTGPDRTISPTAQLAAALRLVQGQPLLGTRGHRGRWSWSAPLEEAMIATIQDVAEQAAERALRDGDHQLVKLAVRGARFADPYNELSWQIELRMAIDRGSLIEVERIVNDLYAVAGHGEADYEPDPGTNSLIRTARAALARPKT